MTGEIAIEDEIALADAVDAEEWSADAADDLVASNKKGDGEDEIIAILIG